jgi:NADPH-dependent glutamate synthase beta subunit-like oxidoreductase/NAD(P)H-flavin reductase
MIPDLPYAADRDIPLGIPGFRYADLYSPKRLQELLDLFDAGAQAADPALFDAFSRYRADPGKLPPPEISDLLMRMAPQVARFVARLFQAEPDLQRQRREAETLRPLFLFKKKFVANRADRRFKPADLATLDAETLDTDRRALLAAAFRENPAEDPERATARMVLSLLELEAAPEAGACADLREKLRIHLEARTRFSEALRGDDKALVSGVLQRLEAWAFAFPRAEATRHRAHAWVTLRHPRMLAFERLVELAHPQADLPELVEGPAAHRRRRDGFELTDPRMNPTQVAAEVDYCLYCHARERDSCATGLKEKDGAFRKNPLGITLAGCPLNEKISEAHALEKDGETLAALAVIVVDNPMAPGTGHRICNDCMKSCIFQKQEPVNIPQIETGILGRVLRMPYGVEIYSLLTRWNPLNVRRPSALSYNGKNVLVVGLGPAGYTLAHYLLNEGFGVAGIDGLKIEPPRSDLAGADAWPPKPVRDFAELEERLDERILAGFGGVAEYGITVRWDKNFLSLIHLTLARRSAFRIHGGVRFGGTVTIEDAWGWGFDHIAIASGAGRPTVIEMKHNLIRGIRKASDFLMALQLTGAAKKTALANLQLRLPVVVVGGGLTAIDTATEALAYYPVQVEKTLARFEILVKDLGEDKVLALYDEEEREILKEFLAHGRAVRAERARAGKAGEAPDLAALVRGWGGSTIAYRKRLTDAPAYRLNHEEVEKALEEGIQFAENLTPVEAVPDRFGALEAVLFKGADGRALRLGARSLLVAAGTSPNTIYEKEHPGTFSLDAKKQFFQAHKVVDGKAVPAASGESGFFTSYQQSGRFISYYGDNHPHYAGNVVKAMASAKDGYPEVVALFKDLQPAPEAPLKALFKTLDDLLVPTVHAVNRLTPTIVELVVRAPMAARRFEPGQFFRLQNYERLAPVVDGHRLAIEGLALTGAWVDREKGLLSLIMLEMGASSRLCAYLRPGERVVVMGPTGAPTEIPENETVLLLGGGLGNAVLFSIAKAMRERRNKVLYFAAYKKASDVFKMDEVEESTDQVIWSVDQGDLIQPRRTQDRAFRGNVVQAMVAYAKGELGRVDYPLDTASRLIAIGSDRMMAAVKQNRKTVLAPYLKADHVAIASLNSPMQCMMKEVCAQCLQKHVDPVTGAETGAVFSCFNQDQPMDCVDFANLNARLRQNTVQEKLATLWLDHLLAQPGAPKAQAVQR